MEKWVWGEEGEGGEGRRRWRSGCGGEEGEGGEGRRRWRSGCGGEEGEGGEGRRRWRSGCGGRRGRGVREGGGGEVEEGEGGEGRRRWESWMEERGRGRGRRKGRGRGGGSDQGTISNAKQRAKSSSLLSGRIYAIVGSVYPLSTDEAKGCI